MPIKKSIIEKVVIFLKKINSKKKNILLGITIRIMKKYCIYLKIGSIAFLFSFRNNGSRF